MPHPNPNAATTLRALTLVLTLLLAGTAPAAEPANPFYAMDTAFRRPGLETAGQFDLVKELGFAGVAWTEQPADKVRAVAAQLADRGLRMHAIYCAAKVTPDGELTHSPELPKLIEAVKGHETIVWLHVGGKGPAFETLTADAPAIRKLRELANVAARHDARVALYPHHGEWTARFADAIRVAELVKHDRFGVTFNLCHALAAGEEREIVPLLERAKPVLTTVTLNGADAGVTGPRWDKLIQTLDKGTYDVAALVAHLRKIQFAGPIGFQGYGIKGEARAILEPTTAAWRRIGAAR